jgi:hypothetical protein
MPVLNHKQEKDPGRTLSVPNFHDTPSSAPNRRQSEAIPFCASLKDIFPEQTSRLVSFSTLSFVSEPVPDLANLAPRFS